MASGIPWLIAASQQTLPVFTWPTSCGHQISLRGQQSLDLGPKLKAEAQWPNTVRIYFSSSEEFAGPLLRSFRDLALSTLWLHVPLGPQTALHSASGQRERKRGALMEGSEASPGNGVHLFCPYSTSQNSNSHTYNYKGGWEM